MAVPAMTRQKHVIPGHLVIPPMPVIPGHLVIPGTGITGACHMTLNGLGGGAVMAVPAMTRQKHVIPGRLVIPPMPVIPGHLVIPGTGITGAGHIQTPW